MADDHPSPPLVERANENESSFVIKANEEQKAVQSTCTFCSAKQKRWGLFLFSVLYVPLFAGAFFGWGPLQILLEANGAFSSECEKDDIMNIVTNNATGSPATLLLDDDGHPAVCPDQTAKLLTVPFVGQLMILTSPVVGALADHFGSLALMAFLTICGCSAVLFLLLAVSVPVDNLLFLFSIGMGLMASATSIIMVKTGMVFADDNEPQQNGEVEKEGLPGEEKTGSHNNKRKDQNQSRVISILNALFDAGSVTYLGLWGMFKLDLSLSSIVGIYLGLAVFCLGGASIFWYTLGDPVSSPPTSRALTEQSSIEIDADDNPNETPSATKSDLLELPNDTEKVTPSAPIERTLTPEISTASALSENAKSSPAIAQSSSYVLVSERPPRKQLLSLPFIMLLLFFAVNLARNMFVLTTARDFLRYLADDEESGETYLTIFTLLMPASLFGLPFSDQVITHFGFHTGFQIVCLLGVVHGLIQISCDELNGVQILGFLVFSFYRCFLFSIVFSYLPTLLAPNVVGKGVGALHMAGGILSFLNIPLSNVAVKYLDGNFFVPNLVYTILAVPCAAAAYLIGQTIKKEAPVKEAAG